MKAETVIAYFTEPIGCFLFASLAVVLKKVNLPLIHKIPLGLLSFMIPSLIVVLSYTYATNNAFKVHNLFTGKYKLIIGLLSTVALYAQYFGFAILPVSASIPIYMLSPIMLVVFDALINGTTFNVGQLGAFILSFIGILLVVMSKTDLAPKTIVIGIALVFMAAFGYAMNYTLMKDAIKEDEFTDEFNYINLLGLIIFFIPAIITSIIGLVILYLHHQNPKIMPQIFGLSTSFGKSDIGVFMMAIFVCTYIGNALYNFSFSRLPVSTYSVIENTEVIASLVIGYTMLNESITPIKLVGCLLIIAGIVLEIFMRERNLPSIINGDSSSKMRLNRFVDQKRSDT